MTETWQDLTWGDIAVLHYGKAIREYGDTPSVARVYGTNGPIGWHDEALSNGPGLIVGRKGAYRGVQYSTGPFWVIDTAYYLTPKMPLDLRWAYYALVDYDVNNIDDGSPMPSTSRDAFYYAPVKFPPLDEQRQIADLLSALDVKIAHNREMVATLEAIARALFQSWFVDFDPVHAKAQGKDPGLPPETAALVPDRFTPDGLPEGWRSADLSRIAEVNPESWTSTQHPETIEYVDLANTKFGTIDSTSAFSWTDAPSRARQVARIGDSIIGTVRPGNGSFAYIGREGYTVSTGFAVLRPKRPEYADAVYIAATTAENLERVTVLAAGHGGAYPAINPKVVSETSLPEVPDVLMMQFSLVAATHRKKIEQLKEECSSLVGVRDMLLPRLISGELRIPDAAAAVAAG